MVESEKRIRLSNLFTFQSASGSIAINSLKAVKQFNDGAKASRVFMDVQAQIRSLVGFQTAFEGTVLVNLNVITFLAGYASFKINRNVPCDLCRSRLVTDDPMEFDVEWATFPDDVIDTSYVAALSRGGLTMPSLAVYKTAETAIRVAHCLVAEEYVDQFLKNTNQRHLLHTLTVNYASKNILVAPLYGLPCVKCDSLPLQFMEGVAMRMTNILLNNYTKERNSTKKVPQNKKSRTLKS